METSIIPGIYDPKVFDEKLSVKTEDAYKMVRQLEEKEGMLVGTSAGAAMVGALRVAESLDEGVVVTIFPDSCEECVIAHGEF